MPLAARPWLHCTACTSASSVGGSAQDVVLVSGVGGASEYGNPLGLGPGLYCLLGLSPWWHCFTSVGDAAQDSTPVRGSALDPAPLCSAGGAAQDWPQRGNPLGPGPDLCYPPGQAQVGAACTRSGMWERGRVRGPDPAHLLAHQHSSGTQGQKSLKPLL